MIASAERGFETEALQSLIRFFERLSHWTPPPPLTPDGAARVRAVEVAWRRVELQNRREFDALGRMFGTDFATNYLQRLLFAIPEAG